MKGVLQTAVEFPDPLTARRRCSEARIVENDVHGRDITVLSRIKAAVRANHILFACIVRRIQPRPTGNSLRSIVYRQIVGHAHIKLLSARRQILPPVEIVIGVDIAARNPGLDLGLNRAIAPGRTEARGLDRAVLCDQRRAAQVLVCAVRCIAPREFRSSLPHLRDVVGIPLTVMFRNARPVTGSAGPRCGIHLLRVGGRSLVRIRHDDVERHTVSFYLSIYGIQRKCGLKAVRIFTQ